jgi:trimeric autotransporter adhesin
VSPADLVLRQNFNNGWGAALDVSIAGTTDKLTIEGFFFFDNPSSHYNGVQRFEFADGTVWDLQAIIDKTLAGTAGNDRLLGTLGDDVIMGSAGNDTLGGSTGNDSIEGGDGDDSLSGGAGNDVIDGGPGNDTLEGNSGNDVFLFGRGDGVDSILTDSIDTTAGKSNTVRFKDGVSPADLVLRQNFNNGWGAALDVSIAGTTDKLTIEGFFFFGDIYNGYNGVQRFEFADGTIWQREEMRLATLRGTTAADSLAGFAGADLIQGDAGPDTLSGGAGDDTLEGGADNDVLRGDVGNDLLDGGSGDDLLTGGEGDDTYRWGRDFGNDRIAEHNSWTNPGSDALELVDLGPADVLVTRDPFGNAFITIRDTGETLQIDTGVRAGWEYSWVEAVRFADGTTWTQSMLSASALLAGTAGADTLTGSEGADNLDARGGNDYLYGRAGDDTLVGGDGADSLFGEAGADTLVGGTGNDLLNGGTGNNVFSFSLGDGQDLIAGVNDSTVGKLNRLEFGDGILANAVQLARESTTNDTLVLKIAGTGDQVSIQSFFSGAGPSNASNPVQEIRFSDGTTWDITAILARMPQNDPTNEVPGTAGNDTLSGTGAADSLDGGGGNDSLYGLAGNDILSGGTGNDYLDGGSGNNTYVFGRGDGQDIVYGGYDVAPGKLNTIELKAGVDPADVVLRRISDSGYESLELSIAGTTDKLTARYFFQGNDPAGGYNPVQQLRFADGTLWDLAAIKAKVFEGTAGVDAITGTNAADTIYGQAGGDTLAGRNGDDQLFGGDDNDWLYGENGADTLNGGAGNDTLVGAAGGDTYRFAIGGGIDEIQEYDATANVVDVLEFYGDNPVTQANVLFRHLGNNLEVQIAGTGDKVVVKDWYLGAARQIEMFRFTDGSTLDSASVQSMATLSVGSNLERSQALTTSIELVGLPLEMSFEASVAS